MAVPPLFSVIIANFNGGAHLRTCLEALRAQTERDFEVIVVDNGSTDGAIDRFAEAYPEARLLRQESNLGFAAANNLAARSARGAWLVLLNNDAFAEPDWLAQLRAGIARYPAFSGFASRQMKALAPTRLDGAGDAYHVSGVPWRIGFDQPMGPPWDRDGEIFIPCACAAAYRKDVFEAAGGFDERFFCYVEDVDLAFRLQLQGHRFMYLAQAVVKHVGSATVGKASDFARYHGHRNLVWCFVKNMPDALLWKYLPLHLAMNLVSLLAFTFEGQGGPLWRAKRDAVRELPGVWADRRAVQRGRTASARDLERRMAHGLRALIMRSRAT